MPHWNQALLFGLFSALSLPLGAWLGIVLSPVSHEATAKWMAFGAGALVYAVATQMYGMAVFALLDKSPMKPDPQPCLEACQDLFDNIVVECIAGLVGAGIFLGLGKLLARLSRPPEVSSVGGPTTERASLASNGRPSLASLGRFSLPRPSLGTLPCVEDCPIAALRSFRVSRPTTGRPSAFQGGVLPLSREELERLNLNTAAESDTGSSVAMAMWLGMLLDGIPESLMMGFMTNKEDITMSFVIAIFVANFPEAFSGASLLRKQGMPPWKILMLWSAIFLLTGVLAMLGSLMLPVSSDKEVTQIENYSDSICEGIAGGMMLAMLATAMLPEAFRGAGEAAGIYFVLGFVLSLAITCVEARFGTVQNVRPSDGPTWF
ncbi:unnamed protein product [Polarella glacialis]|nr:unnamed protein product [Polarella glacialis]